MGVPMGLAVLRLCLASLFFWCLLLVPFLWWGVQSEVAPGVLFQWNQSFSEFLTTSKTLLFLFLLCLLAGFVCFLPGLFVLLAVGVPSENSARKAKQWGNTTRQMLIFLPYCIVLISSLVFTGLSLSLAPQWLRQFASSQSLVGVLIWESHEFLFENSSHDHLKQRWSQIPEPTDGQALVLAVPSNTLLCPAAFAQLQTLMDAPVSYFVESQSAPALWAKLASGHSIVDNQWQVPVPSVDFTPTLSAGAEWKTLYSQEWSFHQYIKPPASMISQKVEAAKQMRLLQAAAPLFWFARWGAFTWKYPFAAWENLFAQDEVTLEKLRLQMISADSSAAGIRYFSQLSATENTPREFFPVWSPLRWRGDLSSREKRSLCARLDSMLFRALSPLVAKGWPIAVLPYSEALQEAHFGKAFVSPAFAKMAGARFQSLRNEAFLTDSDIAFVLKRENTVVPNGNAALQCSAHQSNLRMPTQHAADTSQTLNSRLQDLVAYWDTLFRHSKAEWEFPSALRFVAGRSMQTFVLCRPLSRSGVPSFDTSTSWLITWNEEQPKSEKSNGGTESLGMLIVRRDKDVSSAKEKNTARLGTQLPSVRRSAAVQRALEMQRYQSFQLYRVIPETEGNPSNSLFRQSSQLESVEFFRKWGPSLEIQFQSAARAQL
jgi:hypothetical protein